MTRTIRLPIAALLALGAGSTMAAIWSDDFNNGCTENCLATTWNGWTLQDNVGGTTGSAPNQWFVSCAEEGLTPNACASSCLAGDASLHIGSNPGAGGDMGAGFNDTGATNATFRRIVSPPISTVGYAPGSLTLKFDFIAFGSAACLDDRAQLHLSTNGGATWPVGFQYCLNTVCCGGVNCDGYTQGQWTTYTLALPSVFTDNPDVRIAFHWRNNGNGSGTDPSVAIDDIRLTGPEFDVRVTKTADRVLAVPGSTVQFQVEARKLFTGNDGVVGSPILVNDTFPAGLVNCSTTCTPVGGATCTAGPFTGNIQDSVILPGRFAAPGYSAAVYTSVCTVAGDATGTISNTATATATAFDVDTNLANNTATADIQIVTDGVFGDGFE